MKYLCVFVCIGLLGCKSQQAQQAPQDGMELKEVLRDPYGGTETPQLQVIRNPKALERFFAEINKTRKPGIPVPDIDFSREVGVVYFSGKTRDTALAGKFGVEEHAEQVVLRLAEKPAAENLQSGAVLMPFVLYTMPYTEKEIVLVREEGSGHKP